MTPGPILIGHWPLATDGRDTSGADRRAVVCEVAFVPDGPPSSSDGAARFDGEHSRIEVQQEPRWTLGTGDFTAAAWIHTDDCLPDVVGDVISQYDPQERRGFQLSVVSHPGVTTSMANDRNVHFGIDHGINDPEWTDCGRPGEAVFVYALSVFEGDLYAGTCEPGPGQAGHVYRYAGNRQWEDCGRPAGCNAVTSLAGHEGHLYCGTSRYKLGGSCLPESPNQVPGGEVYRYEGGQRWSTCGRVGDSEGVACLCAFQGRLYAAPNHGGQVYEYQGGERWLPIGPAARIFCLGFWNGHLYGMTSGKDSVYRYDGDGTWTDCGWPEGTHQLYSFLVYQGRPHVGTWPNADVFRYDGDRTWTRCGSPGYSKEVMGMALYNGKLYAGTLPMADVYRYEGGTTWTYTGGLDRSHGFRLRRAWSMAVHDGRLYCGTLPSGVVYSLEAGRMATWDHRLPGGWQHLAAVRRQDRLELWLNGERVALSERFDPRQYDLEVAQPLLIGAGQHDGFHGLLADLRLYRGALDPAGIAALAGR